MKLNKTLKRTAAALCAAVLLCGNTALAAKTETDTVPDLIFYRSKSTETFEGEIDIKGGKGTVTSVVADGDSPALYISEWDDNLAYFDSLFKSAEQTLTVTRGGEDYEASAKLAVYDRVTLIKQTGSVSLTVKDNRTLKAVSGAEYSLYKGSKEIKKGLTTDTNGKITVSDLEAGDYELRQTTTPSGYGQTTAPVSFTIGGIELEGGEYQIRTSAGKKITADDDEVLIAGEFSEDVELTSAKDEQITSVTVTLQNYGAELEKSGKTSTQKFSSASEAEEFINTEKNKGKICGAVEINYTLKGGADKSTCNFVQYVEAVVSATPTPTPTPNAGNTGNNNGSSNNGSYNGNGGTYGSVSTPTPSPTPSVNPIATPAPTVAPKENLIITVTSDDNQKSGFVFDIAGYTTEGAAYSRSYETDGKGSVSVVMPAGVYTVTPSKSQNTGYSQPDAQTVQITAANSAELSFAFEKTERDLLLTVIDDDGIPVEGVTVGVFTADMLIYAGAVQDEDSGRIDISQAIMSNEEKEAYDELMENPYEQKNAITTGKTDKNGQITVKRMTNDKLLIVPLSTPDGYSEQLSITEIPQGLDTDFTVPVEYTKINFAVYNEKTGEVPYDTLAVLFDDDKKELARFTVDGETHTMIRVPDGYYTLHLEYDGVSDDLEDFEITKSRTVYDINVTTSLTGSVQEVMVSTGHGDTVIIILLTVVAVIAAGALVYLGGIAVRKIRQSKGAIK